MTWVTQSIPVKLPEYTCYVEIIEHVTLTLKSP